MDAAVQCGGQVLEVGCGTGRVLVPTALAGVSITGLDVSAEMLMLCRERMRREPADVVDRIVLVEGDMREFDTGNRYSPATLPFRSIQHLLTIDDLMVCLKSRAQASGAGRAANRRCV